MIKSFNRWFLPVILNLIFVASMLAQTIPDTKVSYISSGSVYLDYGSNIGLKTGDRLDIVRNGNVIARIEITYLATASASCKIISSQTEIKVGDIARWIESTTEQAETDTIAEIRTRVVPEKQKRSQRRASNTRVSGVFSVQWYHRDDQSDAAMDFDQWNARLSLRVQNMWTSDLNLRVNTRARFDRRTHASGTNAPEEEWRNRIYWIALAYEPENKPFNFQIGRLASNKFSGLGYLDGLILQHNIGESFNWGIFGGLQPDMSSADFTSDMQKYGMYSTFRSGSYSDTYLQTTLALAGSYSDGKVNREYAYFEFRMTSKSGWRFNQSMEIDYNRLWRKTYSGDTFALTSFYFSGSYKFNQWLTTGIGYDNRKNYLTYAYYSLAQELFDEAQRQSLRADIWINIPAEMSFSIRGGAREGRGDAQKSYNYGLTLVKSNLISKYLQATVSFNGFRNLYNRGFSPAASVRYLIGSINTGLAYGSYRYTMDRTDKQRINQYMNFNFSVPVWSGLYLQGQYYYDWGDDMQGHRVLADIGYRF